MSKKSKEIKNQCHCCHKEAKEPVVIDNVTVCGHHHIPKHYRPQKEDDATESKG